mgnify:CR=1 FL=1
MNVQTQIRAAEPVTTEHFDVLIAGAGISGVGAAYHLTTQSPGTSFVVLETQKTFGGTWSTHRYPGIRSDSDLHTFGYRFKPWTSAPIASAEEILKYMGEVIEENDLARHIRYRHTITAAKWSNETNLWTIDATRIDTGERLRFTTNFFWMCQGYYRHDAGYTPEWTDMAKFKGTVVHPQTWPDNLDYKGKRVVVIGGGDTGSDCIGTSFRQGAKSVTQLEIMPAPPEHENKGLTWPNWPLKMRTSSSQAEGAVREFAVLTTKFEGKDGKVSKLHCVKVDDKFKPLPGTEFTLDAELVLLAMGFVHPVHEGLLKTLGVELDQRGNVRASLQDYRTSRAKIFSAGDMRRGQSLVVWAIREGRQCARSIDGFLMGKTDLPG